MRAWPTAGAWRSASRRPARTSPSPSGGLGHAPTRPRSSRRTERSPSTYVRWPGARLRSMGGADLFEAPWSGCVFAHLEGARPAAGRAPRGPSSPRDDRHPRRSGGSGPVAGDRLRAEGPATRPGLRRAQRRLRPAPQTRNRSLIAALQRALRPITAHYVNVRRRKCWGRGAPERSVFAVSRSPERMRRAAQLAGRRERCVKTAASKLAKSIRLHGHPVTRFVLDGR